MSRPNPRILALLAVLLVFGLGGWYVEAERTRVRSTLSGFFESQPSELASLVGGRVARILVLEGDTVRAGQPLAILETAAEEADTRARIAHEEEARQRLAEMRNGSRIEEIRRQQALVVEQEAMLARLQNGPLPEEIEAARARLRQTAALFRKALTGPRPEEIAQAKAAERSERARLAAAERGQTVEERAQAKARLADATAQEQAARADLDRANRLYRDDAISRQQLDRYRADALSAQAKRTDAAAAERRASEGTPAEELDQARESYRQARAALDLLLAGTRKEDIQAARADMEAARQNLALLLRGSRVEDISAARARLDAARQTLAELKTGNRIEEIRQARADSVEAAYQAKSAQSNLRENVVRASRNGIVERVLVAVGDLVGPNTPVIRMNDPADIWIRVYVPEPLLSRFNVGSSAVLAVDGVPSPAQAVVESISARGEFTPANLQTPEERGKQVFGVRLRLSRPDPRVKAGMYASVKRIGEWQ